MPPLLSCAIYLLVLALGGTDARAVDATITSLPTSNISSSMLSQTTNITASSQSCTDIKTCRTLEQIVVSCLATVLACVWLAVHPNVPAPNVKRPRHGNFLVRALKAAWRTVLDQRDAVLVFGLAFLAPEWILAWAVRQALCARTLCKRLEAAREEAREERSRRDAISVDSDEAKVEIAGSDEGHASFEGSATSETDVEATPLPSIKRRSIQSRYDATCEQCGGCGCKCAVVVDSKHVGRDEAWETSHAFLAIMGGFYFHNADGPIHPLSPDNVVELVQRGHLMPPTFDEISSQRQGVGLSKGVAVIQTLWFALQCVARRAENLPVTTAEVMTLAYIVMTAAMYAAWWAKPLNVSCAIRVPEEEVRGRDAWRTSRTIADRMLTYAWGNQDCLVDLRQCTRVPTFWAGRADSDDAEQVSLDNIRPEAENEAVDVIVTANDISLLVVMVFGAVHCIAWHSEFQSHIEQQLWRASAITIIAVLPSLVVASFLVVAAFDSLKVEVYILGVMYTLATIVLVTARLILAALSFASLRGLPFAAYQTVQWTTLIPHV